MQWKDLQDASFSFHPPDDSQVDCSMQDASIFSDGAPVLLMSATITNSDYVIVGIDKNKPKRLCVVYEFRNGKSKLQLKRTLSFTEIPKAKYSDYFFPPDTVLPLGIVSNSCRNDIDRYAATARIDAYLKTGQSLFLEKQSLFDNGSIVFLLSRGPWVRWSETPSIAYLTDEKQENLVASIEFKIDDQRYVLEKYANVMPLPLTTREEYANYGDSLELPKWKASRLLVEAAAFYARAFLHHPTEFAGIRYNPNLKSNFITLYSTIVTDTPFIFIADEKQTRLTGVILANPSGAKCWEDLPELEKEPQRLKKKH